jgi:hypothetical protein
MEPDIGSATRPDPPAKFAADADVDVAGDIDGDVRRVRRIFLVALAAAIVAAAVTFAFELADNTSTSDLATTSLLPATLRLPGFADGALHRDQQFTVPMAARRYAFRTSEAPGSVVYVVARCDRGNLTVRLGGLTSAERCTGRPVGLVRLTLAALGARLEATVSRPQKADWSVGIFR